jgi:hypothetical protein
MSGPARLPSTADNRYDDQEEEQEQTDKKVQSGIILHNMEHTQAPFDAPGAPPVRAIDSHTISPNQTVFDITEGLAARFPTDTEPLRLPRTRSISLSDISSLNPTINLGFRQPYHLPLTTQTRPLALHQVNPTLLQGSRDFFGSFRQIQQRLDTLQHSSLGLELALVLAHRRFDSLPSPLNDELEIQLVAAQTNELLYQPMYLRRTTHPPSQWPSTVGLGGDTIASPSHTLPDTSTSPMSCDTVTNSALSRVARVTEQFLPFSTEEESRIPCFAGPESFPMVLHRALAELELVEGGRTIATFLPDGLSFCVKDQLLFAKKILPVFFPRMKSFASFQRQLNLYDFERVGVLGLGRGAYRHKLFVRDHPAMSSSMRRSKNKGPRPGGPTKASSKNETMDVVVPDVTSAGESNHEEEAENINNDVTDVEVGREKASDVQELVENKGGID